MTKIPLTQLKGAECLPQKVDDSAVYFGYSPIACDTHNALLDQLSTIAVVLDEEEMLKIIKDASNEWWSKQPEDMGHINSTEYIAKCITQNTARVVRLEKIA